MAIDTLGIFYSHHHGNRFLPSLLRLVNEDKNGDYHVCKIAILGNGEAIVIV